MYIAIEGVDNVGKTTLIEKMKPILNKFCEKYNIPYINYIAETELSYPAYDDTDVCDFERLKALEYASQRFRLFLPFKEQLPYVNVISDRSVFSTYAYQGGVLSFDFISKVDRLNRLPDFVVLLENDTDSIKQKRYLDALMYKRVKFISFNRDDKDLLKKVVTVILSMLINEFKEEIITKWLSEEIEYD